ncbi:alkaline phosphatase family protein [Candidatus Dependentiae bacterium]|nr:alkaline phosphatase family protein [Candidatus Dependentiae bacterium]
MCKWGIRLLLISFVMLSLEAKKDVPKLTVIFVVDQLAYNTIQKLMPYLKNGINFLHKNGVNYTNAFFKHASTATGVGHVCISTGAQAREHGIVNNKWWEGDLTVHVEDDRTGNAKILKADGTGVWEDRIGKSAINIMVDGISDQLCMHSYHDLNFNVYSVSLKPRAAICTAGKLGKAIWFDRLKGGFTSSNAYFKELPEWIVGFNKDKNLFNLEKFKWDLRFKKDAKAYNFPNIDNYKYTRFGKSIIGQEFEIDKSSKSAYDLFLATPSADKLLTNLVIKTLEQNLNDSDNEKFVLWVCLSSLDKIGHSMGPDSLESIDMVYHIDKHIEEIINYIYTKVKSEDVLFALTADHGVEPIAEIVKDMGYYPATRLYSKELLEKFNKELSAKFNIENIIKKFKEPAFYLDNAKLNALDPKLKKEILDEIKQLLLNEKDVIARAWTFDELLNSTFPKNSLESFFKNQLYAGRSGDIFFQFRPYNYIVSYQTGTSHLSPYAYDRQVPLIIYQKGKFEKKIIHKNVSVLQFPVTLANILNVPRPSASTVGVLPGLLSKKID